MDLFLDDLPIKLYFLRSLTIHLVVFFLARVRNPLVYIAQGVCGR